MVSVESILIADNTLNNSQTLYVQKLCIHVYANCVYLLNTMSLLYLYYIADTCAERFPEFKLPRPNVQCPQNISQNISSLSSCFQFQWSLTNESVFDLHECFKEIDQVLNELNITKNNSRDSCFVYACSSLTEKENDFNLCVSEYITKEFLMRKHLNVPQSYLTICHQEDVEDCIDGFIETCVIIKQEKNHFIQTCLNLLFSLCNPLSPQDMTKCKDFIENKIDESIEEICESTTDEACVS